MTQAGAANTRPWGSFFVNLQRLYSFLPGQPGYGDKRVS